MESWRSWGITQKLAGDKFKHEPRDPIDIKQDDDLPLALFVYTEEGWHELILYKMMAKHSSADPVVYSNPRVVGTLTMDKTHDPCIPETFQVRFSAVDQDLQGQGYGSLIYGMAFHYANKILGAGLTSDHAHSTSDKGQKMWDKYADTKGMVKKKTKAGNDEFDYSEKTKDPDDDCDFGMAKKTLAGDFFGDKYRKGNATSHSWIMRGDKFKSPFNQLVNQHNIYIKSADIKSDFLNSLIKKSGALFNRETGVK